MSLTEAEQLNAANDNDYRLFVRRKIQRALWLVLPGAIILLIAGYKPEARGLALGGLFSVLNFYVLARVVGERLNRPGVKGRLFGVAWYVIRLALLAGSVGSGGRVRLRRLDHHGGRTVRHTDQPVAGTPFRPDGEGLIGRTD